MDRGGAVQACIHPKSSPALSLRSPFIHARPPSPPQPRPPRAVVLPLDFTLIPSLMNHLPRLTRCDLTEKQMLKKTQEVVAWSGLKSSF